MINYAHRGASEYAPENTLSSFYLGLIQGANGIETDVQRTKDGVLVLFHDDTIDRITDGKGSLSDYTLEEIKKLKVYGNSTTWFYDSVVTLREFLEKFAAYDIKFAIELKGAGVEEDTLSMVKEFGAFEKTTFTSFDFNYIKKIKELDKAARIGWLTENPGEKEIEEILNISGEEMAPKAEYITEDMVKKLRSKGLGIRAWGVSNVSLMKKMCMLNIDGMTVNFPDRLYQYLR
ncbi:MAG: hypothetical protein IJF61_01455 [Clostridia bacterium]|nr:hypothetical protein [Clostridia bacterium]